MNQALAKAEIRRIPLVFLAVLLLAAAIGVLGAPRPAPAAPRVPSSAAPADFRTSDAGAVLTVPGLLAALLPPALPRFGVLLLAAGAAAGLRRVAR